MLRILGLCLLVLASFPANAGPFAGLGVSGRLIQRDDGNYKTKFPLIVYGGYKKIPWAYALEGLHYQDKSNSGSSYSITNDHYEATLYTLRFFKYEDARAINPYFVGGLGGFQAHVKTNFNGTVSNDTSTLNTVIKLGAGAWAQLNSIGFISLEGKVMYSKYFSPDCVFDLSLRFGIAF